MKLSNMGDILKIRRVDGRDAFRAGGFAPDRLELCLSLLSYMSPRYARIDLRFPLTL